MKLYLPATGDLLTAWLAAEKITATKAFAVTSGLRRLFADAADEELDYHVLAEAGEASLLFAAARPDGEAPARRLVVVAEVPSVDEAPAAPGAVQVPDAIAWRRVTSLHVDDDDALVTVAAAVAELRDGAADAAVEEVAGYELMWFDVTEARDVLAMLVSR